MPWQTYLLDFCRNVLKPGVFQQSLFMFNSIHSFRTSSSRHSKYAYLYKILGFHGGDYEECRLLERYTTRLS
jgi:hypothetical protein